MRRAIIGFVVVAVVFLAAAAGARPPEATAKPEATGDAREVGRVRMRDRIVPLTRASLAEGGAASELKEAFGADVMADIDHEHREPANGRDSR